MSKFVTLHGFGGGNSGTELNFEVVGGTTEPSNPTENMIWVNTSTAITDYIFSATQPSSVDGRVWISTGTGSTAEFNALKKNGIQVYPNAANQYVSGEWISKEAKSYKNGEWVELTVHLLDLFDSFTTQRENGTGSITVIDGNITYDTGGGNESWVAHYSNKKIDLSGYKTLTFKAIVTNGAYSANLGFYANNNTPYTFQNTAVASVSLEKTGIKKNYSLDLSNVNTSAYFTVQAASGPSQARLSVEISDLYLLR